MYLQRDSAAGVRFLAAVKKGRGLKQSARAAGVGKETGYRWLRESFLLLREQGLSVEAAQAELGYCSPLVTRWDQHYPRGVDHRHHLRVDVEVEEEFWRRFAAGASLEVARRGAGVGQSTAYRWLQARYGSLREAGVSVRVAARRLRVPPERARTWEAQRRDAGEQARRNREAAERRAVRDSARHVEELMRARASGSGSRLRDTRYLELMRSGLSNTEASRSWACIVRLERGSVPAIVNRLPLLLGRVRRWAGI